MIHRPCSLPATLATAALATAALATAALATALLATALLATAVLPAQDTPGPGPTPPTRGAAPTLVIKSLQIRTTIVDGAATTHLTQVYHNPGRLQAEAIWVLPLPAGATADQFTMTMNGEQVSGEVLDADRARSIYTGIVRQRRDPGLLEYVGNGCLRARLFPILPGQDMRVEVRYREVLPATSGIHQWRFPLRALQHHGRLPLRTSLDLTIRSRKPLKNVYSPMAGVDVVRRSEHEARASLELSDRESVARDLDVFYGVSTKAFGLDLLTYRQQGKDGYFVMMLAPQLEWDDQKAMPKCINFVIDTSGSMSGEKIAQARGALEFFLQSLKPQDHFNVIPFATEAQPFFASLVPVTRQNLDHALTRTKDLAARGGTNIHDALTTALHTAQPEVANAIGITVFLTDGLASVGKTDTAEILADIAKENINKHRIFVFGVGDDVNTTLLDKMAQQSHGDRDYVRMGENIELKTSALFAKLSHPVMSGVKIVVPGIEGFDIYPKDTPDLFRGTRLLVTGRYRATGDMAIRLTGMVDGQPKEFVYQGRFAAHTETHDFIPTLWAQRKVAMLLDHIRLDAKSDNRELVEEIRRLGQEHGIVTPYSSHLILEESDRARLAGGPTTGGSRGSGRAGGGFYQGPGDVRPSAEQGGMRPRPTDPRGGRDRAAAPGRHAGPTSPGPAGPPSSGGPATGAPTTNSGSDEFFLGSKNRAINYSVALKRLAKSRAVVAGKTVRRIGGHTFHHIGGVWIDAAFKAGMETSVRKVKAFSDEYFELLKQHAELTRIFALGSRVIVVLDGKAIETT